MRQAVLIPALFLVGACAPIINRAGNADSIAVPAAFSQRQIATAPFTLTAYEHITTNGPTANIYIEGDGLAWVNRTTPSLDPTPVNPIGLRLAVADPSENVVYLARPCQYSKLISGEHCPQKYWTSHRFAPEVIGAMNNALNNIKRQYGVKNFNLIGYSGGANIAALVAANRIDILTIRTVAGNLNNDLLNTRHKVSPMPASLNAVAVAPSLNKIPQHHFIGADDSIVTPEIAESFVKASRSGECIRLTQVANIGHAKGWAEQWPRKAFR